MLASTVIIMTVMGCNDDATRCELIDQPDRQWASIEACETETTEILRGFDNADYPVVAVNCTTREELAATLPVQAPQNNEASQNAAPGSQTVQPENLFDQAGVPLGAVETRDGEKRILVRVKDGFISIRKGANNVLTRFVNGTRNGITGLARSVRSVFTPKRKEE